MRLKRAPVYLRRLIRALYIPAAVNCPLLIWLAFQLLRPDSGIFFRTMITAAVLLGVWAAWIYLNIVPWPREEFASRRLTIMEGGGICASWPFTAWRYRPWGCGLVIPY